MFKKLSVGLLIVVLVLCLSGCTSAKWYVADLTQEATAEVVDEDVLVSEVEADEEPAEDVVVLEEEPVEPVNNVDSLVGFLLELLSYVKVVPIAVPVIALLVDMLKRLPGKYALKDGYAPLVSGLLNLGVYAAYFFLTDKQDAFLDGILNGLTVLGPFILTLFGSVLGTASAHTSLASAGIGYSRRLNWAVDSMYGPKDAKAG